MESLIPLFIFLAFVFSMLLITTIYSLLHINKKINFYWYYLNIVLIVSFVSNLLLVMIIYEDGWFINDGINKSNSTSYKESVYQILFLDYFSYTFMQFVYSMINLSLINVGFSLNRKKYINIIISLISLALIFTFGYVNTINKITIHQYISIGILFLTIIMIITIYCKKERTDNETTARKLNFINIKNIIDLITGVIYLVIVLTTSNCQLMKILYNLLVLIYSYIIISLYIHYDISNKVMIPNFYKKLFILFDISNSNIDISVEESDKTIRTDQTERTDSDNQYVPPAFNDIDDINNIENTEHGLYLIFYSIYLFYKQALESLNQKETMKKYERLKKMNSKEFHKSFKLPPKSKYSLKNFKKLAKENTLRKVDIKEDNMEDNKVSKDDMEYIEGKDDIDNSLIISLEDINDYTNLCKSGKKKQICIDYYRNLVNFINKSKEENIFDEKQICEITAFNIEDFEELISIFNISFNSIIDSFNPSKNINIFKIISEHNNKPIKTNKNNKSNKDFYTNDFSLLDQ